MKSIQVYADFDFLTCPEEIGTIIYDRIRGKDYFSFSFSDDWLKSHKDLIISGDLLNIKGSQYPTQNSSTFGFIKDSFPDRWGRILLDRKERLMAQSENRPIKRLTDFDYLTGIEDLTRIGGIRYKFSNESSFINTSQAYSVPPIKDLYSLYVACEKIESAEEKNTLPEEKWINQLVCPGTSLAGARPKANIIDNKGTLYIAKFPSRKDISNIELIEHFSHIIAKKAGTNAAETKTLKISKDRNILLSKRFDRINNKRVHFSSAMALLGLSDGCGADTGNGYLDIVDFIIKACTNVQDNLKELYRRVAFNILYGNTDDHFRNHGFILTSKGWTLSPAYDINPSYNNHQCLLINENTELSDIQILLNHHESYLLDYNTACDIIKEVKETIKNWRQIAINNQIPINVLEQFADKWDN